jgi:cholesterol oxidase
LAKKIKPYRIHILAVKDRHGQAVILRRLHGWLPIQRQEHSGQNYLYFAEKLGAQVIPEVKARDIRPLSDGQTDGARYEVIYSSSTAWFFRPQSRVRARNVIVSAGTIGTLELLFRCREVTKSLTNISSRLGERVRTNSENILGVTTRGRDVDYSKGIAITSIFSADEVTRVSRSVTRMDPHSSVP